MIKKALTIAVVLGALLTVVAVASADHSWSVYHWPGNNLSPTVVDKTSSSLYDVPAGVLEWSDLGTPIQPTLTNSNKGNITVTESFSPFWLGLARIFLDDTGHITKGEVKLNTKLLESYGPNAADHVLCQEIGHVLGLDHNRDGATGGTPDNSCMNDVGHLGAYTSPNVHDIEQLLAIYNHTDVVEGGDEGGSGGGPPCDKNPSHPKCQTGNGHWITVHTFWAE
jgi:hypothetical protein